MTGCTCEGKKLKPTIMFNINEYKIMNITVCNVAQYYSAPELVHIFPYPTNNLFITYALLSQKAFGHLLYNFHQQNLKNNICIKQTKIEIQNESKTIVATSVSKAGT